MKHNQQQLTLQPSTPENLHWGFWCGVAFFVLVIAGILSMAWLVVDKMSTQESAPVTSIAIGGEMPYTDKRDIEQAIDEVELGNFFNVDVNDVQEKVAALPWVYSVSVRKKWPNELKIYVVDQTPVAYWNGDFLINKQGYAFQADMARVKEPLPAFFGPEGTEEVALKNYKSLSNLLSYGDLAIDELMLSERYSWQLTLNDGVSLNLGRKDKVNRLQRFMDLYPQIKATTKQQQQVDYIDLRYGTGLAVGWKPLIDKKRV